MQGGGGGEVGGGHQHYYNNKGKEGDGEEAGCYDGGEGAMETRCRIAS